MPATAVDILTTIRAMPREERRVLVAGIVLDFAEREGRAEAVKLLIGNLLGGQKTLHDRQAKTLVAFASLPKDVIESILAIDPATIRLEDCIPIEELDLLPDEEDE